MLPSFYASATATLLNYHLLGFTASDDSGLILSLSWHTPFTLLLSFHLLFSLEQEYG